MKKYKIYFNSRDLEVTLSWLEDRIEAGHWGDNIVMTDGHENLLSIFKSSKPGYITLSQSQLNQIIHDAEKCFAGKFGMFNPVGSIFEIATLYKLNKAVGKGNDFLSDWELTEDEINSWLDEYY